MRRKTWIPALLLVLFGTACSADKDQPADPVPTQEVATSEPEHEWEEIPFSNDPTYYEAIRYQCDGHGHRIYQTSGSSPRLVVIDDSTCPGGKNNDK